jgi:hypothetical protein
LRVSYLVRIIGFFKRDTSRETKSERTRNCQMEVRCYVGIAWASIGEPLRLA